MNNEYKGIHVQVPDKTMDISCKGELILTLRSLEDWAIKVPRRLGRKTTADMFLFLDKNGHALSIGADFQAAEDMNTYPVSVYKLKRVNEVKKEMEKL